MCGVRPHTVRVQLVCGRLKPGLDGSNPPLDLGKPGAVFGPGVFQEGVVVIERERERGALVVQNSQVVVRSRVAGGRPQCTQQDLDGLVGVLIRALDESYVDQQVGVSRFDVERCAQLRTRFRQAACAGEHDGQVAASLDVPRIDLNRAMELVDRFTRHPATVVQQRQVVTSLDVQFIIGKHSQVLCARPFEVAKVLVAERESEVIDAGA